jgi:hypothetical protein
MSLPAIGTAVNYYWEANQSPVPALVLYVDDLESLIMVSYIPPTQQGDVVTSPWASQGTGVGQWEALS